MMHRIYSVLLLGVFALLPLALAQSDAQPASQDELLAAYQEAFSALNASVKALPQDGAVSGAELEQAQLQLTALADNASAPFVSGLSDTFERARDAIRNRSQVDLAVQVAVLKGGFHRLVYEAALQDAAAGEVARSQRRLAQLAADMGLPVETQSALGEVSTRRAFQATFEAGIAETIGARLATTRDVAPTDTNFAYQAIAQAYGKFIPVQDSPRLPAETADTFVSAFGALVGAQSETLNAQVTQLTEQMQTFEAAANAVINPDAASAATSVTPDATLDSSAQVEQLSEQAQTLETAAANPDLNAGASAGTPQDTAQPTPQVQTSAQQTGQAATGETLLQDAQPDALSLELQSYRLGEGALVRLESDYRARDIGSVQAALDALYARGAKALAAAQLGDATRAQILVGEFGADYRALIAPLLSNNDVRTTTSRLIEGLQDSPALRPQDLSVLLGQLGAVSGSLQGAEPSLASRLSASTGLFWMGPIRLSIMIILCFFAFVPLYLLNLAFGGGNRNWQYIGVALLLLLLPVIFEGLSFIGSAVATFAGVGALSSAATLSIFQTPIARVAWALFTGIAIAFASVGLYGICVQFGLLGKQEEPSEPLASDTQLYLTSEGPDTAIDWDEEF